MTKLTIGIPLYPGVDLLDVVGPHEVFSWMRMTWPGNEVAVRLLAETLDPVTTMNGARVLPDAPFRDASGDWVKLDVLFVPGAGDDKIRNAPPALLDFVRAQADATWVCSVCTGALILAEAGLLDGYRATTHWTSLDWLRTYRNVRVAEGYPRYVLDGNRVTGGGISSGLDESLALVALVTGDPNVARKTQLAIQYHPQPDFDCGDPGVADAFVLDVMQKAFSSSSAEAPRGAAKLALTAPPPAASGA
ncbi:MAG TPA: DJ-1/PfpI family protein [Longimicrobium sp.]|nr:DJ-1/PfpI family protein [Longimicrobium sp.]